MFQIIKELKNKLNKKPILDYVETPIVAHCNLRCKNCTHFCNFVDEKIFVDIEEYKKDLTELSKKVEINTFRIMGGEPLLHPDIIEIVKATRIILPDTTLNIVTNGILLPKMPEKFYETIRDNKTSLDVTIYPIWNGKFNEIFNMVKSKEVSINIRYVRKFIVQLNKDGNSDYKKSHANCRCKLINMWNHKLYPCQNAFRYFYNKKHNTNMELPPAIDFYKLSGKKIYKKLVKEDKAFIACRFCNERHITDDWQRYQHDNKY